VRGGGDAMRGKAMRWWGMVGPVSLALLAPSAAFAADAVSLRLD